MRFLILLVFPLVLAGCNAEYAGADGGYGDYHFHDVRKPHGRARSERFLQADAATCMAKTGHSGDLADLPVMQHDPRYVNCLLAHGWKFYAYTPPAPHPDRQEREFVAAPETTQTRDPSYDAAVAAESASADAQAGQASIDTSNAIQDAAMIGR
jgi:hypothetical protein